MIRLKDLPGKGCTFLSKASFVQFLKNINNKTD